MVYTRLQGGLGNQMFQYAAARQVALKHGVELVIDATHLNYIPPGDATFVKRDYDLGIFKVAGRLADDRDAALPLYSSSPLHRFWHKCKRSTKAYSWLNGYTIHSELRYYALQPTVRDAGPRSYLNGYWQNPGYFRRIESQIRHDFEFADTFSDDVLKLGERIASNRSLCVNVRRGDFVTNPTHGTVGIDYLLGAVREVRRRQPVDQIYVFSDDIEWCRRSLEFDLPMTFVGHELAGPRFSAYLYLMRLCSDFVIPNSSFGWWAAFLASGRDKVVVTPKKWINLPGIDTAEILPDGWISL